MPANPTGYVARKIAEHGYQNLHDLLQEACHEYSGAPPRRACYKVPSVVEVLDELPRTSVGKLLRRQLRDLVLAKRTTA